MGLLTASSASCPFPLNSKGGASAPTAPSIPSVTASVPVVVIAAAPHPSITNVSVYGHGNMAPALTEPLSQTNKLSSSATSASPRPSPNSLISDSESVSGTGVGLADLNNHHHSNILTNSSAARQSVSPSFGLSNSANKNGSFQSAFEQFQQIRKLQQNSPENGATKGGKRRYCNKLSPGRRQRTTSASSFVNGRLSNGQMGPMCDTNIKFEENSSFDNKEDESREYQDVEEGEKEVDDDEQKQQNPTKKQRLSDHDEEEDVHTQHMDYSNCDEIIQNESQDDVPTLQQSNNNNNNNEEGREKREADGKNVESSDNACEEEQTIEINQDPASADFDDTKCDNPNQQLQLQAQEEVTEKSSPRTPSARGSTPSLQPQSQTPPTTSLTPQSTTPSGMGLQKDFIKDTAEMEQVLGELGTSDMDLLQVLKGFDTTPGGEGAFCELSLFTDVDVMSYDEVGVQQQPKDAETKEVRNEIEKRQLQMQRKCDFLLRRLRKIQTRYMGKHTSEEVAGLFEWQANPTLRRKEPDATRSVSSYEDDKRRQISTAAMKSFVRRINTASDQQHSSLAAKRTKVGRPSNAILQAEMSGSQSKVTPVVPPIGEKMVDEIAHVSGHLHTELKGIQSVLDSDATASSSGGESADEMQLFNNTVRQPLSISKRAAWKWLRDRAAIASRWTWLLAQISDLEYRIRQHNELHHQIKKNKGAVSFEKNATELSTGASTPASSPILPSSVNGYRGVLPGNNAKSMDVLSSPPPIGGAGVAPNGAYDSTTSFTSGSCRTRAFQRTGFRKRKLLQTANVHTVSKKAARPSTVKCGCQWPLHPCGLCTGRPDPTAPRDLPDTMTPSERVALLDSGFHPVLSFPEDVSHSIHFEATIRLPEWQNRVIRCSSKPSSSSLKGAVAVHKAAEREDRSKKYLDSRRKYNRKYPQDIMAANKLKNAKARRSLHGDQYSNHLVKSKHRKLVPASLAAGGGFGTNNGAAGVGGMSSAASSTAGSDSIGLVDSLDASNGLMPRSKNASPTPGSHGSSAYKYERMDRRHRNSYDIDNIVIPYSVAAATRVEILPYKEIPTPKWRIIDESSELLDSTTCKDATIVDSSTSLEKTDSDTTAKCIGGSSEPTTSSADKPADANRLDESLYDDEDGPEDISDDTFVVRHERALIDERKKFQTYLKYPWSTRSRANRRTDSRAESSGANTPDPSSPAPNTPSAAGDQESVPSPTAPLTPQTPLDGGLDENASSNQGATPNNQSLLFASNSAAKRVERKRTASGRKEREHSKDDSGGNVTPDGKETASPYEPLEFPLADDVYETMLELMPNDHQLLEECLKSSISDAASDKASQSDGGGGGGGSSACGDSEAKHAPMDSPFSPRLSSGAAVPKASIVAINSKVIGYETELLTFGSNDNLIGEDSDTDSAESGMPDEDPNDPEWREPE